MSAATYMPLSKIMDVWGRAEGFLIMTVFSTLGLILLAASNGIATFCAAYVRSVWLRGKRCEGLQLYTSSDKRPGIGILQHWLRRHDLRRRRHYS